MSAAQATPLRFAVIGNPIAHSRSPDIHVAFAKQFGIDLVYERVLATPDGFVECVNELRTLGYRGLNVTVPFKLAAFDYAAGSLSAKAQWAQAVNTLNFTGAGCMGHNTDGIGLVNDLKCNLNLSLTDKRILILGAGGAARGVLPSLLDERPAQITVVNRTEVTAQRLIEECVSQQLAVNELLSTHLDWRAWSFETDAQSSSSTGCLYDIVINATATGLTGDFAPPNGVGFAQGALAYDMMYGKITPFLKWAQELGARTADGWGMLVEQAAKSFEIWHGVAPDTCDLIAHPPHKGF
ncbi:shikimate dehydrogenase [Hydromonas duriensis]|uniref:Shikimate dehydrogenase (NADP(+)) n=1 Tax=Hydromonas duriensis TaxID=1527608 RepID=A0A4R6YC36_9BURK|nr:shikimate dehydrogenase [Hydromonas duriensis]TDR33189.1 shikimate dehydrogenase [Hydromonas duriensis]